MKYLCLCVSLVIVTLAGCKPAQPVAKSHTAGAVKTDVPKKKPLHYLIVQPASVEAFEEAPLVARISGDVAVVKKDIGDEVKRGNLLAELSVPDLLKEHAQREALVKLAKAEVEQANALVGEAEAAIVKTDAHVERWESEHGRVDRLFKSKVVEQQILDETLSQFKSAKAARLEADAKLKKAQADVGAANARVEVARAEEGRLKELTDYRFIVAPFDGVVTRRNVHPGHFLQPNASGGPAVLFVVTRTDKLRIIAEVPETDAIYITDKLDAAIQVPALKDQKFAGKAARTSDALDPKSRTLRVEIDFVNKEQKLRPGMFANVIFDIELKEHFTLPMSAIFTHSDMPCCWRVDDGKAVRAQLKLGVRVGPDVEVLKMRVGDSSWEPITGNERIVVTNLGAVSEGKAIP